MNLCLVTRDLLKSFSELRFFHVVILLLIIHQVDRCTLCNSLLLMNEIASSVSNLSLDSKVNRTDDIAASATSKRHKRPNRAFHTFDSSTSTPVSTPSLAQGNGFPNQQYFASASQLGASKAVPGTPVIPGIASTPQQSMAQDSTMSHYVSSQRLEDQQQFLTKSFLTSQDSLPPLATTQYYSVDQGVCDPRIMSLSMYNIPRDEQLRSATKLPVGVTVQPFAVTVPESQISTIHTVESNGPLRCRRCRAYVNPGFAFTFDSKAVCNFCQVRTQLPQEHFAPLGPDGRRSDLSERADLLQGCVDFVVPESYNAVPNVPATPLHYVFLIDVSTLANENKSSVAAVEGVRACIEYISVNQPKCKVAIIAYDKYLRFFNLRPELSQAQEYIVSDLKDVFLPLYTGLFVRPDESMHVIQDTLCKLTAFIEDDKYSHRAEVCYGSAIEAAKLALHTVTGGQGGKIISVLNSLPVVGNGNLKLRTDDNLKKSLKCENEYYLKLGKQLLGSHVSVDLYCTGSGFVDMVDVAHPALVTSGVLKYYPNFHIDKDEFTLVNDMLHNVSNTVGYQAQLKVRCSSGLSVCNYYCPSVEYSDRDPLIPVLRRDQSWSVLFKYDNKLTATKDVCFQAALLYTDINGVRKVRSVNTNGAVSDNIHEIFKFVNQDVVTSIIVRDIISTLGDCNFVAIRKLIDGKIIDILTQYRALVGSNSTSQLVLPDSLKTLPAYLLSFEKSDLMKSNSRSSRGNARVYDFFKFSSYDLVKLSFKLYPQIFPLHELLNEMDLSFYDENDKLLQFDSIDNLSVRNAHNQLINGGCYLIFDGDVIYLWFNENTNQYLLRDLLDVDPDMTKFNQITLFGGKLPELDTEINMKARNTVKNWCQLTSHSYIPVILARPSVDQYYSHVMNDLMCEDKSIEMIESYENYLVSLHRKIKEKLQHDDYVKLHNAKEHEHFSQKFIQF